jgi:hypothetical protein
MKNIVPHHHRAEAWYQEYRDSADIHEIKK